MSLKHLVDFNDITTDEWFGLQKLATEIKQTGRFRRLVQRKASRNPFL